MLAPRAPTNEQFLEDLEKTMALLVFPHDKLGPDLAPLLDPSLRQEVADRVNKAILERQTERREAAIRNLVRLRAWAATEIKERGRIPEESRITLSLDLNGNASEAQGNDDAMNVSY
jgi:glucose-induced degradation protein 8